MVILKAQTIRRYGSNTEHPFGPTFKDQFELNNEASKLLNQSSIYKVDFEDGLGIHRR